MKTRNLGILAALFSVVAVTSSRSAQAQGAPLPAETLKAQTATTGKTDVAKGGFATGALPSDEDPREATEASIGAGGLFSSGNSRTVAVTGLAAFKARRDEHQFTTLLSANFARGGKTWRDRRYDGRELPGDGPLRLLPHEQRRALPPDQRTARPVPGPRPPVQPRPRRRLLLHQHEEAEATRRGRLRLPVRRAPRRVARADAAGWVHHAAPLARQDEGSAQRSPLHGLRQQALRVGLVRHGPRVPPEHGAERDVPSRLRRRSRSRPSATTSRSRRLTRCASKTSRCRPSSRPTRSRP